MCRIILAVAVIIFFCTGTTNAEQAAADEYRKIFGSGNFYVEFKDKWGVRILAGKNGVRMERMRYHFESGGLVWLNPLGAVFGGGEVKNPEVLYKNGKYYQFIDKDKAEVCDEKNIHDENINPRSGWNKVSQKLALPDELAIFFREDPFRMKSTAIAAPTFAESLKKDFNGKEYECDKYTCNIETADGKLSAVLVYELLYSGGKLFCVESSILRNGKIYPLNVLEIKLIQSDIPPGVFKISKNTKLYAAAMGDMYDLLETPKLIGTMEEEL